MLILSEKWRRLGAVVLAALTFNIASAQGLALAQSQHPLLNDKTNAIGYHVDLSNKLVAAMGESTRPLGKMVAYDLNEMLAKPSDEVRRLPVPRNALVGQLQAVVIVPPKGLENENIPVCFQQNNEIKMTIAITNAGKIVDDPWNGNRLGSMQANGKARPACVDYFLSRKVTFDSKSAAPNGTGKTQQVGTVPATTPAVATGR